MRLGRALGTAMLPCLLVLTACNGTPHGRHPAAPTTGTTSADAGTGDGQTAAPALDPAHAVDPPGKRTGAIAFSDIIVNGSETLDPATIDKIQRLKGVQDVEAIALAEVPIENQALTVAAVDPATYRNFTDVDSARKDVFWDRVAGGELALRPGAGEEAADRQGRLPPPRQHRRRPRGAHRCPGQALPADRRRRQRHLDPDAEDGARQRAADPHRQHRPRARCASRSSGS